MFGVGFSFGLYLTHLRYSMDMHNDVLGDEIVSQSLHLTKPLYNGSLLDSRYNGNGRLGAATPVTGSGSRTPAGDDWELDCEICHRHGINLVSASFANS
jgi:hypothetical protein